MNDREKSEKIAMTATKLLQLIRRGVGAMELDVDDPDDAEIVISSVLRCGFAILQHNDKDIDAVYMRLHPDKGYSVSIDVKRTNEDQWMSMH
jgi:hypothetical protein